MTVADFEGLSLEKYNTNTTKLVYDLIEGTEIGIFVYESNTHVGLPVHTKKEDILVHGSTSRIYKTSSISKLKKILPKLTKPFKI
jgi:hypothetical protein